MDFFFFYNKSDNDMNKNIKSGDSDFAGISAEWSLVSSGPLLTVESRAHGENLNSKTNMDRTQIRMCL